MKVKIEVTLEIPQVPNFLKGSDGQSYSVGQLSDDDLRSIGTAWIGRLLERAKEQRAYPLTKLIAEVGAGKLVPIQPGEEIRVLQPYQCPVPGCQQNVRKRRAMCDEHWKDVDTLDRVDILKGEPGSVEKAVAKFNHGGLE